MMKEGVIGELQTARQFFLNSISCLQEEDSAYAPQAGMYTVAQQVMHTAQSIEWFIDGAFGSSGFDMNFERHIAEAKQCESLDQAIKRFNEAIANAIQTLQNASDADLTTPFPSDSPIMAGIPKMAAISGISDHTAHHRGVLTVYSRLLGKIPQMPYGG